MMVRYIINIHIHYFYNSTFMQNFGIGNESNYNNKKMILGSDGRDEDDGVPSSTS